SCKRAAERVRGKFFSQINPIGQGLPFKHLALLPPAYAIPRGPTVPFYHEEKTIQILVKRNKPHCRSNAIILGWIILATSRIFGSGLLRRNTRAKRIFRTFNHIFAIGHLPCFVAR